jgi:hypothetical protein
VTPKHVLGSPGNGETAPKWSERVSLERFATGEYELRVIATDPATNETALRRVSFRVE